MLISLRVISGDRQTVTRHQKKERKKKSLLKEVPYVTVSISLECKDLNKEFDQFCSFISSLIICRLKGAQSIFP